MLHILLLILKIIGIILGTLLAVLLIGLCLVLFVPVRYRIEAGRTEEEGAPPIEASVRITWLLHLVNIRIQYPADVYLRARIFLFTIFRLPQKQKKAGGKKENSRKADGKKENSRKADGRKENSRKADDKKENSQKADGRKTDSRKADSKKTDDESADDQKECRENGQAGESIQEAEGRLVAESVSDAKTAAPRNAKALESVQESNAAPEPENVREPESEKKKISLLEKLKEGIGKIRRIFQKIWYTLNGICDKIKAIWGNIEYYMGILQSDTFRQAFSLCKGELFSIFSYIRPRKFQAELTIGTDDPAATGKILSYYGMLYPFIGGHVTVIPDFERKRIEGTVFIRGKIKMFTFIKAALRIYFNKDIRKLLKLFKKEDL